MRNWARSAFFGLGSWGIPLGLTFFATPLIVKKLGIEEYGLYALITGFISFSFTFSIGRAITKYVAEYRALGRDELINEVLAATLWINFIVGFSGTLITCVFARFIVVSLLSIEPALQEQAIIGFYIASPTVVLVMQAQIFGSIAQAVHRLDIYSGLTTIVSILGIVGNIVIVLSGYGLITLFLWNAVNVILSCVFFYLAGKRLLPEAKWRLKCRREIFLKIAKFAVGTSAHQLIFNSLLLLERGLITRRLGTENLTYYVVPMNLTIQIHMLSGSLLLMIFPLASDLGARLEIERLLAIYKQANRYFFAIVTFIVLSVSVCEYEFFSLWLSPEFADKTFYVVIFQALIFGTIAVSSIAWQIIEGLGYARNNGLISIPWAIVSFLLMLLLIQRFELDGVAAGRLLGCCILVIYIKFSEKKIFGDYLWHFWTRIFLLLFIPAFVTGLTEFAALRFLIKGWTGLFVAGLTGGTVYSLLLLIFKYVTLEDRLVFKKIFSRR